MLLEILMDRHELDPKPRGELPCFKLLHGLECMQDERPAPCAPRVPMGQPCAWQIVWRHHHDGLYASG